MSAASPEMAPFGLSPQEFRRLGHEAVELAAAYVSRLPGQPVFSPMTQAERAALLEQALPEDSASPDALLGFIRDRVLPHPMGNGHPRFFGWVNSPPAMLAVVTEILAAAMNPSCAGGDHAAIYLERCAVRWLMEIVGFPVAGSMGLLVSGGSMASLTALAAARHRAAQQDGWNVRAEGLQRGRPPLVLYMSSEGHGCLRKAAELLGLGAESIRVVPADGRFRMDVAALRAAIRRDRSDGLRPFCVAATAGTVNSGALDPLEELVELCRAESLWLHVDGAYGAMGILDPALRPLYAGLGQVDSLALDPHKWLSVPVECGCVLVRDAAFLRDAFSLVPPYLRTDEGKGFGGSPWYSEYGFQQTRGYRALKLWVTLAHAGRRGLEEVVSRHNRLARHLARLVAEAPDLELCAPVTLSIVCFRFRRPGARCSEQELDALNKRLVEAVQSGGRAFITGTLLGERYVLRACVLHYGTTEGDVAALIQEIRDSGARVALD